jgi:hypothetical protein
MSVKGLNRRKDYDEVTDPLHANDENLFGLTA